MTRRILTRCLVLSDTHGDEPSLPKVDFDVVLHCGDLTEESKLDEFKTTLIWLKEVKAPLKLVIAGNHDFTLDEPFWRRKIDEMMAQSVEDDLVQSTFGSIGEARQLFESEDVKASGIVLLDEGTHQFNLANGALLTVYASPFTPSLNRSMGFGFQPDEGHNWDIRRDVDVAMTHGPPRGILDYTDSKIRAGCPGLFSAIARARPQLHCFGHIHEGWGAKKVTWRVGIGEEPTHFTAIDNRQSESLETLATFRPRKFDIEEVRGRKKGMQEALTERGYCSATRRLEPKKQTMFINAAIEGDLEYQRQLPWTIELDLPSCKDESKLELPSCNVESGGKKRQWDEVGLMAGAKTSCKKRSEAQGE